MTDDQYLAWLKNGGRRIALVEVDTSTPHYLASVAYTTLPTDTPANRVYLPCVDSGVDFTARLALEGLPSLASGDIVIRNDDGRFDSWLDEIWVNRSIRVYIGDLTWPKADFRLVFSGVVAKLESSEKGTLNVVLRSKLERLNTPVTESTLGGSSTNKDRLLPITLGEVHNIEPLLTDDALHEYQFHAGASERVIEVRDNGVPVSKTDFLSTGKFRLTQSPAGTITASVQGSTSYVNTVAALVERLATSYGTPSERFTSGDIDSANFTAFAAAHTQKVGLHLRDRANVLECCQQLAASIGSQVTVSSTGLLRLHQIALPAVGTPTVIKTSDYEALSLEIRERTDVIAGVKLGYCKNWTVQTSLDTGIPSAHKDLFAQEWLTVSARDATVASNYRLYADAPQIDTLLLVESEAQAEATRRLNLWKVQRTVFGIRGYAQLLLLELGDPVTLYGDRFGLDAGRTGIVIGLKSDWMTGRVDVEILV